jgi:uncharacterized cupin superfamily protein
VKTGGSEQIMTNPKQPIHVSEVPADTWYSGSDREIHGKALSDVGGAAKIGVGVLELPPGSNTRPAHYHTEEEEHLYVLEGEVTLHLGDRTHQLVPGSYIHFPASQQLPHYLANESPAPVRYIMIGERIATDQVVYA